MIKIKNRIVTWCLLIVMLLCIIPKETIYAADAPDKDFTITGSDGTSYSTIKLPDGYATERGVNALYGVWLPSIESLPLEVNSSAYVKASCGCGTDSAVADKSGKLTLSVRGDHTEDCFCYEDFFDANGKLLDDYIDNESAVKLIPVALEKENSSDPIEIIIQVGGTNKLAGEQPDDAADAPDKDFTITGRDGTSYSTIKLPDGYATERGVNALYGVWLPSIESLPLEVNSSAYVKASCGCGTDSAVADKSGKLTLSVRGDHTEDCFCYEDFFDANGKLLDDYIDNESAVKLIPVALEKENSSDPIEIIIQVGGTNKLAGEQPDEDKTPPEINVIADSVKRTSETTATVTINSTESGKVYYSCTSAEGINTAEEGIAISKGDNNINVTGLSSGATTVYFKAKDAAGNITPQALEVSIPAFVPSYELYLGFLNPQYNKGYRFQSVTINNEPAKLSGVTTTLILKEIPQDATVKIALEIPESGHELHTVSLITNDSNKTPVEVAVNSGENSFTFTMPAVNVRSASGGWFTLKESVEHTYRLTADASLLFSDVSDSELNRQGTVSFTNKSGHPIVQAKPGEQVTVTATPKDLGEGALYKYRFAEWKNERGISVDENRNTSSFSFIMPENDVYLLAQFENVGTEITWNTSPVGVTSVALSGVGNNRSPFIFAEGASLSAVPLGTDWMYQYEFIGWTVTRDGEALSESELNTLQLVSGDRPAGSFGYATWAKFKASGEKMTVTANFRERAFAAVTATVNDPAMGSATVAVGDSTPAETQSVVYEDQTVTLTATPGARYTLKGWEVKVDKDNTTVEYRVAEDVNVATFTMPATKESITAMAIFEVDPDKASPACDLSNVTLIIPGATSERNGTKYTIKVPADTDEAALAQAVLKLDISEYAAVKKTGEADNWPAAGKACDMTLDQAVTFTVYSEKCLLGKDDKAKADYTVTITKAKSSEKDITAVKLLNADKSVIAEGKLSGTTWTITLPSDTDKALINKIGTSTDVFMQINYTGVSLAQAEGYDDATGITGKWSSGNVMCGISPNSSKTFTVTAEDDSTKTYTVEIKYTAPNAPTLSNGSATRTSKTGATVKFTSSEAGNYFYKVVDHGATVPTVDTSKSGTAAVKGENTITLSNLTEDARDIYIVVVNASRGESTALKVEIPAYGSGSETPDTGKFTITINAPKGGTITTNRTKADKGDEIIVTVTPDNGYQMADGSLTYSLAVAGGETVKITGNRFTMPAGNVTITCKWETATVASSGITGFSINGVAGAVNNSTNTITITMPRGTDVTKLTPVIATNGVKSLTPGSGETVDFTNAVTYTAAMEDGSSKTYTVTVYVDKGTLADQFWDKLTDFATQVPWWQYAEKQQSTSKYPKYW